MSPRPEGLSSAAFERVVLDGRPHVVKRFSYESDWIMRMAQDVGVPRVVRMFEAGWFDRLPDVIDPVLVEVAFDPHTGVAELLMRDVSDAFLLDANPFSARQHAVLLDALAQLHAATQDAVDDIGLMTPAQRWTMPSPSFVRSEALRGPLTGVPAVMGPMWQRLAENAPQTYDVLAALVDDPTPLVAALASTPRVLVHGDPKGGNCGITDDGRVVLVDWAYPGVDAPCADLGWYLAVNCDRLPESKEATIDRYRRALERHGMDTTGWWDVQLPLALLGAAVQSAWSKCDQPAELAWWSARVATASAML